MMRNKILLVLGVVALGILLHVAGAFDALNSVGAPSTDDGTGPGIMLLVLFLGIYFFPALIALGRKHHNWAAIVVLNLLLGWTVLGWIGALVWSFTAMKADA